MFRFFRSSFIVHFYRRSESKLITPEFVQQLRFHSNKQSSIINRQYPLSNRQYHQENRAYDDWYDSFTPKDEFENCLDDPLFDEVTECRKRITVLEKDCEQLKEQLKKWKNETKYHTDASWVACYILLGGIVYSVLIQK